MAAENPPSPEISQPYAEHLNLRESQSEAGVGTAQMTIAEIHRQGAGVVQGGLLTTQADHAFYLAVRSTLKPGEATTTIELKLNFLAPAREGELTATAKIISRGGRIVVGTMEIVDQNQTQIAVGLGTYIILRRPSAPRP